METRSIKYLMIGAGPTALGAAYRLKQTGDNDFLVLEKLDKAGGLARSFVDEKGFTWDIGGHVQFSHYDYFDKLMVEALAPEKWFEHKRSAWALMMERFVPYPVQNNLRYLPREKMWECIRGIIAVNNTQSKDKPTNFYEWIQAVFGTGLADIFMIPYNFKVWACPAELMSYQWIGERVSVVGLESTLKNIILESDDATWGPNSYFKFPSAGGTGIIWDNVSKLVGHDKFVFNCTVTEIDHVQKKVRCSDGREYAYQHLISTMPADVLGNMLRPRIDNAVLEKLKGLVHSSSNIVGLGLKGQCPESLKDKSWIYFPEDNCPFYRATVFSNYSPANVPDPTKYWSLMTETSESTHKKVDHEKLVEDTIQGCINAGLITSKEQVYSRWMHREEFGYPVPSLHRDEILRTAIPYFEQFDIYSRGRFGGWKYEVSNQDHSLMQGVELINRLKYSEPETTYSTK
jgi:protoporphyrinogen oxidase